MAKKTLNLDLLLGAIIVLVFIGFSYTRLSLFEAVERHIYDAEMRFAPGEKRELRKVVLIDIDDKSLTSLGSWPWPRYLIAQMIDILNKSEAKLVGINIPFVEKESNPGLTALKLFHEKFNAYPFGEKDTPLTTWMVENLRQMEESLNSDKRLVESVQQSGNVVLPAVVQFGSSREGAERKEDSLLSNNFLSPFKVSASLRKRLSTNHVSLPFSELAQNVLGLGHDKLTLENSMAGRSHPMFVSYKGSLLPSFPLRLAMGYHDVQPRQVLVEKNQIRLKGYDIPLINGELLIKFQHGPGTFPQYPFVDILQAKQVPPILKGRIVLIGFNSRESRRVNTPVSPRMSEGELIAIVLDNIINNTFIIRPPFMSHIEILAIFLLGGIVSYIFPRMGQLSRLGSAMGLTALTLSAGLFLLFELGTWLKTAYIANCILTIYLTVSLKQLLTAKGTTGDSIETNRLLGLSFQSQGLLNLAFDKFRRLPVDNETKDLIYGLGLEYERKRMINKALSTYEYINKWGRYRDLDERIPQLKASDSSSTIGSYGDSRDVSILADPSSEARSRVGRYDIIEELGKGSMGQVYKALDPKINRLLAIKTIRFSDEFEEDVIQQIKERFFREAEIAGQLSHPSIVTIYDVGEDRDLTYMAMEFLEGVNLEKYIIKGNLLPFRKTLDVIADVAEALDFAHKADVIHRDIKPANIMLLKSGGVKVTDFGIAKAISSSRTKTGVILGTPNYMSPEQIMGQKIDLRSDIFSLGVLFFQLLTGELPFHGENLSSLLYQITQVKHPSVRSYNPKIPKVCEQILDKTLAKDSKDRFRSAGEMVRVIRLLASKIDELKKKRPMKKQPLA
ncbi:MAG: CHASE2 domain-containing protein [Deltaproteobacteria bacterium]|nr:MAG: CHASE2 domain-containing protein [Deltaproteobacteria bacterium]